MAQTTPVETPDDMDRDDNAYPEPIDSPRTYEVTDAMAQALANLHVNPAALKAPVVPMFSKMAWEDLCINATRDPNIMASPILAITTMVDRPEDTKEFDDYIGMVYFEAVTEEGDHVQCTTSRCYRETGEMTPLGGWMLQQRVPFLMRVGRIKTRRANRHVVRPLPIDLG